MAAVIISTLGIEILMDPMMYGVIQLTFVLIGFVVHLFMWRCLVDGQTKLQPTIIKNGEMVHPDEFQLLENVDPFNDH